DWLHTYGTNSHEYLEAIAECSDGGFLLGGRIEHSYPWIVRTDVDGKQLWNQSLDPDDTDYVELYDIKELQSGEIIVAGVHRSQEANYTQAWLAKLDTNGTVMWSKIFSDITQHQICKSLILCQNGDFLLLGDTANSGYNLQNLWMLRTTDAGHIIWQKTFIKEGNEEFWAATETYEGGIVITGSLSTYGSSGYTMSLLKTNSSGSLLWNKTYSGNEAQIDVDEHISGISTDGRDVIECDDNGLALVGRVSGSNKANIWLIRTDEFGTHLWNKTVHRSIVDSPVAIAIRQQYEDFIVLSETREDTVSSEPDILLTFIDDEAPITPTTTTTTTTTGNGQFDVVVFAGIISAAAMFVIVLILYGKRQTTGLE
ncbi:MAG: hypothetical protein ACFFEV_10615, partial [Candidatus Thorarchaeota archaeon]